MIFPGHVAAPLVASRYLDIDRRVAVIAGLAPDLVDKFVFYVLHASHWTRIPAHSLLGLFGSLLAVAVTSRLWRRDWHWAASWLTGYGLHLLCDTLPPEGVLPWLWPLNPYTDQVSTTLPWFLGGGPVPWVSLIAEITLVIAAIISELGRRRAHP